MKRGPTRSTQSRSSAASDVYKRHGVGREVVPSVVCWRESSRARLCWARIEQRWGAGTVAVVTWSTTRGSTCTTSVVAACPVLCVDTLSLIHISEPTRPY
eukprot:TRINITY_DN29516_c0_g1_i1.p1 TRINITY_DN29516_c0_g1~~TRINITY_DN29516_c0_g1_i1.p1  ORF type:complete len:100 (-),score=30.61 TRINITY_DN29516_c0_g1_i1:55-354(-)